MKKHIYQPSVNGAGGQINGSSKTYEGGRALILDETIPGNSTNLQLDCDIDVSAVKSIVILADRDMTLEFNDSTTGEPTLALKAGVPYIWNTDSYNALLLTADVTTLYVTLAAGADALLKIDCLSDPTP